MNLPEALSHKNYWNIEETLADYKALLSRWIEVKNDEVRRKKFSSRNRNPLFDISNSKYFKTELGSTEGLVSDNPVQDHYIQRSKAVELIFGKLEQNPEMSVEVFLQTLRKYCSTVSLTKDEHRNVTSYCKKNKSVYNYQAYEACGIRVEGLSEIILAD